MFFVYVWLSRPPHSSAHHNTHSANATPPPCEPSPVDEDGRGWSAGAQIACVLFLALLIVLLLLASFALHAYKHRSVSQNKAAKRSMLATDDNAIELRQSN